jgi:hypothetical protein
VDQNFPTYTSKTVQYLFFFTELEGPEPLQEFIKKNKDKQAGEELQRDYKGNS